MNLMTTDKSLKDDDYMTPKHAWESIASYLPKDKTIWEAFRGDGSSAQHLKDLGFRVESEDEDFFQSNRGDIIVTNPPFSLKAKVLQRLKELGKPFVLILPASTLGTQALTQLFPDIQVIVPHRRIQFVKNGKPTKGVWFASFFYCWQMNLPRDLIFLQP